jgi:hypothetical protein
MKNIFGRMSPTITVFLSGLVLLSSGCTAATGEGFAIYLTRDDVPTTRMEALSHVELAGQPVIAANDILSYNAQTHEMKLSPGAFERILQMDVPVWGRSFLVCVDRNPVYWGAFWTPISSISFDGVTIWKPYGVHEPPVITLALGYPSPSFYVGEDLRNNPEIIKALERAGKLINKLSITTINTLPHAMKGYELYSWLEDGKWRFTLITGTNRNKTPEEIFSRDDFISEAGWVNVHAAGIDGIKAVLSKLPRQEFVTWLGNLREEPSVSGRKAQLPPDATATEIKEYAGRCGLGFQIAGP